MRKYILALVLVLCCLIFSTVKDVFKAEVAIAQETAQIDPCQLVPDSPDCPRGDPPATETPPLAGGDEDIEADLGVLCQLVPDSPDCPVETQEPRIQKRDEVDISAATIAVEMDFSQVVGSNSSQESSVNNDPGSFNTGSSETTAACYITHTGTPVNVRSGAGSSYGAIGQMQAGDQLSVLKQEGDWYNVTFDGQSAWVSGTVTVLGGICPAGITPVLVINTDESIGAGGGVTPVQGERLPTGPGGELSFPAGASVDGTTIVLEGYPNPFHGCHFTVAPAPGKVTNGVIFPWDTEMGLTSECSLEGQQPAAQSQPPQQQSSGDNSSSNNDNNDDDDRDEEETHEPPKDGGNEEGTGAGGGEQEDAERRDAESHGETDDNGNVYVDFDPGEEVEGAHVIYDDGSVCESDCHEESAEQGGRVYGGVVNPWEDE